MWEKLGSTFEAVTAVLQRIQVFWDVTFYSCVAVEDETLRSFETSGVTYHVLEHLNPHKNEVCTLRRSTYVVKKNGGRGMEMCTKDSLIMLTAVY